MDIDLIIVLFFLGITLTSGIYKSYGFQTFEEFAVSDRKINPLVLLSTICATWYGGQSLFGRTEKSYEYGIAFLIVGVFIGVGKLFYAYFIAPKMSEFSDCISVGDVMNKLYGREAKIISGIAAAILAIGAVGAQLMALSYLLSYYNGVDYITGMSIGAFIVIFYSAFGGIRAVTFTDVIQLWVIIIVVPLILVIALEKAGGFIGFYKSMPINMLSIPNSKISELQFFDLLLLHLIPLLDPALLQRLLLSKNTEHLVRAFKFAAICDFMFYSLVGFIGLVAYVIEPDLNPRDVYPYLLDNIIPIGFKGIAVSGILALIMSSADSYLNIFSVCVTNDVIVPLNKNTLSENLKLLLSKLLTVIAGFLSVYLAINYSSVIDLTMGILDYWGPTVSIPLMAGVIGFKASKRTYFLSVILGVVTMISWKIFSLDLVMGLKPLIPSIFASLVGFFYGYYFSDNEIRAI